ncbi:MAG: tRNA pseudouridine(55) synthase TruB, partial [Oscillospiraceae bacterium]|nr:tRNA pseudouridine(55) synthase TruB [Oscillospiraceae bacterium]
MTGILLLDKPQDMTSFTAASRVKRITGTKKTGHTGTLDPMATGVLPILLGGATRFCELLPSHDKAYVASLRLGQTTDTLDITGEVLSESEFDVSLDEFEKVLSGFVGTTLQKPPMYSAKSQNGVRLYKLARQGIEVERASHEVTISVAKVIGCDEAKGEYTVEVECSAGTYIRSLISDIGEKLGCGAVMTALRRTKANDFLIENCLTVEELEKRAADGSLGEVIIPVETALSGYRGVTVTQPQATRFTNG